MWPRSVSSDADRLEVQLPRVAAAAGREEDLVGAKLPARLQAQRQRVGAALRQPLEGLDRVAEEDLGAHVLQRAADRVGELLVHARQDPVAAFHQGDAGAERREEAGVLGADDAAPDDGHRPGDPVEIEDPVAVHDVRVPDLDASGGMRRGARGDEETLRRQHAFTAALRQRDRHGPRIHEARGAADELDGVPVEVPRDLAGLLGDHVAQAVDELAQALLPVEADGSSRRAPAAGTRSGRGRSREGSWRGGFPCAPTPLRPRAPSRRSRPSFRSKPSGPRPSRRRGRSR